MSKRFIAVALSLLAIVALILVGVWLFGGKKKVVQPLPPGRTQYPGVVPGQTGKAPTPTPSPTDPAERERQAQDALNRQASTFAASVGSYSNADGFASIKNLYTQVTSDVKTFLETQRAQLLKNHPTFSSSWGQTTRALSSKITSPLPILSKNSVDVRVQSQQTIESIGASPIVSYMEADITFQKSGDAWIVSQIAWKPFQP